MLITPLSFFFDGLVIFMILALFRSRILGSSFSSFDSSESIFSSSLVSEARAVTSCFFFSSSAATRVTTCLFSCQVVTGASTDHFFSLGFHASTEAVANGTSTRAGSGASTGAIIGVFFFFCIGTGASFPIATCFLLLFFYVVTTAGIGAFTEASTFFFILSFCVVTTTGIRASTGASAFFFIFSFRVGIRAV